MTTAVQHDSLISCRLCEAKVHSIRLHLKDHHPELDEAGYVAKFPDAPLLSEVAKQHVAARMAQRAAEQRAAEEAKEAMATVAAGTATAGVSAVSTDLLETTGPTEKTAFHEAFMLGSAPQAKNSRGEPIMISRLSSAGSFAHMVPSLDASYVFNVPILKTLLMGMEMNIPVYLWGHAGVGKTTIYEQIASRTNRPMLRVQHTANMEEEHVLGGYRLRDGKTVFDLGPLPLAMKFGWIYLADEYDFARPEVLALYQPVLEGKPLVIKEADLANRVIEPHPNFRIIATGNTNGQGDETGLYSGTLMQNAANYERFGIVEKMQYMEPAVEALLVAQKAGISRRDAEKLIDFATRVREQFDKAQLSNPISPRSLIYAAKLGVMSSSYLNGLQLAYLNRLSSADREAALGLAQRVFGEK